MERKNALASVNVTSLLEYIYPEMSLVKWDSKLEARIRQLHTLGSLFEKGGCFKKCVAWRDSPCFRTKNKVNIAICRIGEQFFFNLETILARNPGINWTEHPILSAYVWIFKVEMPQEIQVSSVSMKVCSCQHIYIWYDIFVNCNWVDTRWQ
jgi:hypothetical protein